MERRIFIKLTSSRIFLVSFLALFFTVKLGFTLNLPLITTAEQSNFLPILPENKPRNYILLPESSILLPATNQELINLIHDQFGVVISEQSRNFTYQELTFIYHTLNALPKDMVVGIVKRIYGLKADPDGSSGAANTYGDIYIWGDNLYYALHHEMGHLTLFRYLSDKERDRVEDLYNRSGSDFNNYIRAYSMGNKHEDFADFYWYYLDSTPGLLALANTKSGLFREKLAFVAGLFEKFAGQGHTYIFRSEYGPRGVKILRAKVRLTADRLPDISGPINWEEF